LKQNSNYNQCKAARQQGSKAAGNKGQGVYISKLLFEHELVVLLQNKKKLFLYKLKCT
jgi:hypothetical protein